MKTRKVHFLTDEEEEFVNLFIDSGFSRSIASVLVFMAGKEVSTSREIERGTDLRQPEVSIAVKYLTDRGWIDVRKDTSVAKGRPFNVYTLKLSMPEILDCIEKEKKEEVNQRLALLKKIREFF